MLYFQILIQIEHFTVLLAKFTLFLCIILKKKICIFNKNFVKFPPTVAPASDPLFHNSLKNNFTKIF